MVEGRKEKRLVLILAYDIANEDVDNEVNVKHQYDH